MNKDDYKRLKDALINHDGAYSEDKQIEGILAGTTSTQQRIIFEQLQKELRRAENEQKRKVKYQR
jgi:hypothetical protein